MSACDRCIGAGAEKSCNRGHPCFQCIGKKKPCTYTGYPVYDNIPKKNNKSSTLKRQPTPAEVAAGAASRAGSPAYEESNAENSNVEEAAQAALRKEVAAMTKESELNKNKKRKSKSRKSRKSQQTRKLKYK
jgi:hypothetical protein